MAALIPTNVYRESMGSMTLNVATFSSVTTAGDTWASALAYPAVFAWATGTSSGSAASGGVDVIFAASGTSNIFTITPTLAAPVTLFILAKT